ncbi:hypothetical protein D9M68_226340 [compost metagenome]
MLLTIRDVDDDLVDQVKNATLQSTGSKAFVMAARQFLAQRLAIAERDQLIAQLREQVAVYRQTLARARDSAIELAEIASQDDLLMPKETTPARLRHLNR